MPTLMQKIRLALKGWSRRRDEERERVQKEFVARSAGWGQAPREQVMAGVPERPALQDIDIEGLVVAFLDDSGAIAWYLDSETGEVVDVRDGTTLARPRYRRVPGRNEAADAEDRRVFVLTLEVGKVREAFARAAMSRDDFRQAVAGDRSIERRWYSFKNGRVIEAVEEWLRSERLR
jgi:hypothetical protein